MIMKKIRNIILAAGLMLLAGLPGLSFAAFAEVPQDHKVSGQVTDDTGESLPGVNVMIKGTSLGTITDIDGNYSISVQQEGTVLVFSFIGMTTQEVEIGSETVINVVLEPDAIGLEEVVALGYTSQKKKTMVGSVARINTDQLANPAYASLNEAIQGKASGVYVTGGQVRVRGINSINLNTNPLWIIDGVPGNGGNINPNEIKTITVLKDAAATALYGAEGAGGVIVVTTTAADAKDSSVMVELSTGFREHASNPYPLTNTAQYLAIHDQAIINGANYTGEWVEPYDPVEAFRYDEQIPAAYKEDPYDREYYEQFNTKMYDELYRTGRFSKAYVSATKSFEDGSKAYLSVNYQSSDPMLKTSYQKSAGVRFGFNFSPVKNLDISFVSNSGYGLSKRMNNLATENYKRAPTMPLYDETDKTGYWSPGENPMIRTDNKYFEQSGVGGAADGYLKATYKLPIEGLSIGAVAKAAVSGSQSYTWKAEELLNVNHKPVSWANEGSSINQTWLYRGEINYKRSFDQHNINVYAMAEAKSLAIRKLSATGTNLTSDYHILGVPQDMNGMSSSKFLTHRNAMIGQLSYDYAGKYLFNANIRRDGMDHLHPDNRYAVFPSLGFGWIISEEDFFNVEVINLLKLRGSMGKTGNAGVPAYAHYSKYRISAPGFYSYDDYYVTRITNLASRVKWETSDNLDFGFDYGFLNNRLNGSFAWYRKDISGMLLKVPLPPSAGVPLTGNKYWDNIGNMRNWGLEFDLNANVIRKNDFNWNIIFNISNNHNEILALNRLADQAGDGIYGAESRTLTKTGEKLGTYYLADFAGIDPQTGIPMIWERDATIYAETRKTVRTGNKIPASEANAGQNQFLLSEKSSLPNIYGGLSNNFTYKGFSFNVMLTYSGGNYFIDQELRNITTIREGIYNLWDGLEENSWKQPGDQADYGELIYKGGFYYDNAGNPSTTINKVAEMTTQYLKRGDLVQLKEISLSYNFDGIADRLNFSRMRAYFNINNLAYWSAAGKFHNPEISLAGANFDGYRRGSQMLTRTYTMGLVFEF